MNRIVTYILALLLVATLGTVGWYAYSHPRVLERLSFAPPCSSPIPYRVGSIDPRFSLTKEEIVAELGKAEAIWEKAAGKALLVYAPDDPNAMPVHFVYDARQQAVNLGQKIDSTESTQEAERAEITRMQQAYSLAQDAYAQAVKAFNERSQAYAEEVKRVNASGGADAKTYARLNEEQQALKDAQAALRAKGDALEAQGRELEARIATFNSGVRQINKVVNAFNSTLGGEFEEGLYVEEADGSRRIDIYAYKSLTELRHTLTHEFGHALGLGHNENPTSVMFPYNKSGAALSSDDLADLKKTCEL